MDTCKRHPDRPARRRCFQCKNAICPECQSTLDGHIFCSHACHIAWQKEALRARWKKRGQKILHAFNPLIWWRYPAFRRVEWAKRSMLLTWLLLLTSIGMVAGLLSVQRSLMHLQATVANVANPAEILPPAPVWIEEPVEAAGIASMRVAAPVTTVVLRNGRPIAEVAAGTATTITLHTGAAAASVWSLAPAETLTEQRWTIGTANPEDLRRATGPGIALTFDGGADRNAIDDILRTLQRYGVQSTFFLTGEFISRFAEDTRRILRFGHEVGNHTWSHPNLTTFEQNRRHETRPDIDRAWFELELLRTAHIFAQVTGDMMAPYWRAPYGETNAEINGWASDLGYQHVGWTTRGRRPYTLDTLDWVYDPNDPLFVSGRDMARRVVVLAQTPGFSGGIVLMHVGTRRKTDQVHKHLPDMIEGIRNAGIPMLTVSRLIANGTD